MICPVCDGTKIDPKFPALSCWRCGGSGKVEDHRVTTERAMKNEHGDDLQWVWLDSDEQRNLQKQGYYLVRSELRKADDGKKTVHWALMAKRRRRYRRSQVTVEEVYDVTDRGVLDVMRRHSEQLMIQAHQRRPENERVAKYLAEQSKVFADAVDKLQVQLEQLGIVHGYQF
jgi:hypothetical protein